MKENKTTTYGDLKCRKAELRAEQKRSAWLSKPTIERLNDMQELRQVSQAIKAKELFLLYSITPDESYGELPIKPKVYKRVKYVVIAISIAVILSIALLLGCHTVNGVGRDLSAWSSPYIYQEK